MEQQPNRACEQTNSKQKQNQVTRHIQINLALYCSIQPTSNAMVSLKDARADPGLILGCYKFLQKKIEHRNKAICRKIIDSARSKKVQFCLQ